jgi:hypothetical protein
MAAKISAYLLTLVAGTAFAQEYQAALQVSPQGGGKCIDVPDREFVPDKRLQMSDCNNSAGQTFSYDPASMRLKIGGLCLDANGGQPGELVKLWPCDGGPNQVWKVEPQGGFVKLLGINGHCLDIRYGSQESGAPLQSWPCPEPQQNQLWSLRRR